MDRQTRAQQRAAAIDTSPARLAAEIERLIGERDVARRQAELARQELARIAAGGPIASDGGHHKGGKGKAGGPSVESLQKERDEYLAALQRERAEFVNFKRRTAEERQAMLGLAAEGLISKVLALADDFDRAIDARPETIADDPWVEGITAIDRKLRQLLESEGVSPIATAPGTPFDPREHEAVASVPGTGQPDGSIVGELRRGYRLRDRVLRPALVVVAAGAEEASGQGAGRASDADAGNGNNPDADGGRPADPPIH
jgi:molecular chaperone GrpE